MYSTSSEIEEKLASVMLSTCPRNGIGLRLHQEPYGDGNPVLGIEGGRSPVNPATQNLNQHKYKKDYI